ncbi:putative peptidoglycan-binding domain-containing protein [Rivularia sp. PCC 7116]|uniref:peptidoglycan-binding domain-containing protein n=1 Tax=Rivularia sp. PCC 7116 TaxID=373994 RepID=UPI00029F0070|nr:peptidoglycan-binding protein [Rivularia sp. PCC 7116]AFY52880.1 putative peptidoglycan-binding domain-containing protein [Rivularia sp. PCC 7116]
MTTTTSNRISKPVLKKGSTGEAVKELQKLLLHYGMYVYIDNNGACAYPTEAEAIDGVFGSKTEDAVKLFQGKMFLVQDGIVGNKTWQALYKGAPVDMPILKKGSTGVLVKQMQDRLFTGGYYSSELTMGNHASTVDGIFGLQTESAIKNLQKNAGLVADGIVSDRTWFEISKIQTIFC